MDLLLEEDRWIITGKGEDDITFPFLLCYKPLLKLVFLSNEPKQNNWQKEEKVGIVREHLTVMNEVSRIQLITYGSLQRSYGFLCYASCYDVFNNCDKK